MSEAESQVKGFTEQAMMLCDDGEARVTGYWVLDLKWFLISQVWVWESGKGRTGTGRIVSCQ